MGSCSSVVTSVATIQDGKENSSYKNTFGEDTIHHKKQYVNKRLVKEWWCKEKEGFHNINDNPSEIIYHTSGTKK